MQAPGAFIIKLFTVIIANVSYKRSHPSLIFARKTRAYPIAFIILLSIDKIVSVWLYCVNAVAYNLQFKLQM